MQTCPRFFLKSLLEFCSVKFVDTLWGQCTAFWTVLIGLHRLTMLIVAGGCKNHEAQSSRSLVELYSCEHMLFKHRLLTEASKYLLLFWHYLWSYGVDLNAVDVHLLAHDYLVLWTVVKRWSSRSNIRGYHDIYSWVVLHYLTLEYLTSGKLS